MGFAPEPDEPRYEPTWEDMEDDMRDRELYTPDAKPEPGECGPPEGLDGMFMCECDEPMPSTSIGHNEPTCLDCDGLVGDGVR